VVDLLQMSDEELQISLRGSPMKRTKAAGLRRNAAIALQNADHRGEKAS
jgi:epoxyqueuosine reductase QueG